MSVPVRLGPIAPDPLPVLHPISACVLCLHPTPLPKLTLHYPLPTWQPLVAHLCQALVTISYFGQITLLWPNNTLSRGRVQTCKISLASLEKTIGRALSLGTHCHWIFILENTVCRAPNLKNPSQSRKKVLSKDKKGGTPGL